MAIHTVRFTGCRFKDTAGGSRDIHEKLYLKTPGGATVVSTKILSVCESPTILNPKSRVRGRRLKCEVTLVYSE